MQVHGCLELAPGRIFEHRDVSTCDERPARAHQDDGGYLRVRRGTCDRVHDGLRHAGANRVDGRIVDGDQRDVLANGVVNRM